MRYIFKVVKEEKTVNQESYIQKNYLLKLKAKIPTALFWQKWQSLFSNSYVIARTPKEQKQY